MSTLVVVVTYGLGGADPEDQDANVVERVTANRSSDGTWTVTSVTPDGSDTRAATDEEAAEFDARLNPPATSSPVAPEPDPVMSAFIATLTDEQRAALASALGSA